MQSRKDSLSQYDQSGGLYDLRNTPIKRPALKNSSENAKQELDRQILKRISQSRIWGMLGLGFKYLFIALMMPAYIIFYGIPKWLIKHGWPVFRNAAGHLSKSYKDVVNQLTRLRNRITPSKQGVRRALGIDFFARYISKCRQWVEQYSRMISERITSRVVAVSSALVKLLVPLKTISVKTWESLKRIFANVGSFVKSPKVQLNRLSDDMSAFLKKKRQVMGSTKTKFKEALLGFWQSVISVKWKGIQFPHINNEHIFKHLSAARAKISFKAKLSESSFPRVLSIRNFFLSITQSFKAKFSALNEKVEEFFSMSAATAESLKHKGVSLVLKSKEGISSIKFWPKFGKPKFNGMQSYGAMMTKGADLILVQKSNLVTRVRKMHQSYALFSLRIKEIGGRLANGSSFLRKQMIQSVHIGLALLRILPKNTAKLIKEVVNDIHQRLPFNK